MRMVWIWRALAAGLGAAGIVLSACSTGEEPDSTWGSYTDPPDSVAESGDVGEAEGGDDGGGGGEAGGEDAGGPPTNPRGPGGPDRPDEEQPEPGYCDAAALWNPDWIAQATAAIDRINAARSTGWDCGLQGVLPPVPPVAWNAALTCATRIHSGDMANRNYFDHDSPEGHDPAWRFEQAGFTGTMWAENIGAGYPTADTVVDDWLLSDVHCAHMLNPEFRTIGIGYAFGPSSAYAHYWTLALGD